MSYYAIEKALYAQLKPIGLTIIQENESINETKQATPFIEVYNLPAATETLDKCLADRYNGTYQVSVFDSVDKMKGETLEIVDQVLELFYVNELPELDNVTVAIDSREMGLARRDGGFFRCDISINYFTLNSRT